jgi:alcohol dehydrogenase
VDSAIRAGYLKEILPLKFPATLGGDFSGVIVQVGEGVSDFKKGDKVYGQAIIWNGGSGSLAEFAAANAVNTGKQPKSINDIEAASLPLAGVSALQALEENIKLKAGQKILIHGGAGGIGSIAIQIAKGLGGYVATTASAKDKDYSREGCRFLAVYQI